MRKNSRNRRSVRRRSYSRNRKLYRSQKMRGGGAKKKGKGKGKKGPGSQKRKRNPNPKRKGSKRKGSKKPEQVFGGPGGETNNQLSQRHLRQKLDAINQTKEALAAELYNSGNRDLQSLAEGYQRNLFTLIEIEEGKVVARGGPVSRYQDIGKASTEDGKKWKGILEKMKLEIEEELKANELSEESETLENLSSQYSETGSSSPESSNNGYGFDVGGKKEKKKKLIAINEAKGYITKALENGNEFPLKELSDEQGNKLFDLLKDKELPGRASCITVKNEDGSTAKKHQVVDRWGHTFTHDPSMPIFSSNDLSLYQESPVRYLLSILDSIQMRLENTDEELMIKIREFDAEGLTKQKGGLDKSDPATKEKVLEFRILYRALHKINKEGQVKDYLGNAMFFEAGLASKNSPASKRSRASNSPEASEGPRTSQRKSSTFNKGDYVLIEDGSSEYNMLEGKVVKKGRASELANVLYAVEIIIPILQESITYEGGLHNVKKIENEEKKKRIEDLIFIQTHDDLAVQNELKGEDGKLKPEVRKRFLLATSTDRIGGCKSMGRSNALATNRERNAATKPNKHAEANCQAVNQRIIRLIKKIKEEAKE